MTSDNEDSASALFISCVEFLKDGSSKPCRYACSMKSCAEKYDVEAYSHSVGMRRMMSCMESGKARCDVHSSVQISIKIYVCKIFT